MAVFGNNKSANGGGSGANSGYSANANRIGEGTIIHGEIKSDGVIRIDGKVIGTISTKDKIVIGSTGSVEGDISCKDARIEGSVQGKVEVTQRLDLTSTANLNGDIITNKLVVEEGAKFNGTCNTGGKSAVKSSSNGAVLKSKVNGEVREAEAV